MMVSQNGGTPSSLDGLFHGKCQSKMDDERGYPYFRKPPVNYWGKIRPQCQPVNWGWGKIIPQCQNVCQSAKIISL